MGDVARKRIESLIEFLSHVEPRKKKGKKGQGTKKQIAYWSETKSYSFILQIGEPMLRDSLLELYFKKYEANSDNDMVNNLKEQMRLLQERIDDLEKGRGGVE